MAREYAKLLTRIWADNDFKQLTANAQRLYFQIISQPDISMAGVVTLAEKRWSLQVADQDEPQIGGAVRELEARRFVVVDRGSQEVLIRSFVRSDEAWKSPTSMKGVESAVRSILSPGLKAVVRDELARIDTSKLSEKVSEKTGRSTREFVDHVIAGIANDFADLTYTPTDTPTGGVWDGVSGNEIYGVSHGVSDGVSHTPTDGHKRIPHSTTTEPEPEPTTEPTYTTRKSGATRKRVEYPDAFEDFWNAYPIKRDKGKALKAWEKATRRTDPDNILAGATRYREDPNRSDQYTKYAEGWLNGDGWEDEPLPTRTGQLTFDQQRIQNSNNLFEQINNQAGGDMWRNDSYPKQIGQ